MSRHKRTYAAVIVSVVICAVILTAATVRTRREAQAFLSELEGIKLGPSGYEQVQLIAARFRSHMANEAKPCTSSECSLTVKFENTWLRRLHIATWTTFGATLLVRNGELYYVSTGMALYSRERVITAETDFSEGGHGWDSYRIITKRWGDNQPWQAIVRVTPQATPSERKAAFSFNLNCLNKLGGCRDSSDLLPSVWKDEHGGSR